MLKSVKVKDYMSKGIITFKTDDDLFNVIDVLLENRISGAPVVDQDGKLKGILSEVDCLKSIIASSYHAQSSLSGGQVSDFMTQEVSTIKPDADIIEAAEFFTNNSKKRLPVVEDDRLVGQISRRDILRAIHDYNKR